MAFINDITGLFFNRNISIEIDPALLPELTCLDKTSTNRIVTFNLYKLIYYIGTIQSRRFATSNRLKWIDKVDLIEKISRDTNEFRIRINDIRQLNGSETLKSISEDFGVGISVVIAEKLFNIKSSTIERIYGSSKRPDWKCQTLGNKLLVIESKGSTSYQTSASQQQNAIVQKNKVNGDIKIASLTVLNENSISTNRFIDPPINASEISEEMENHILRAGHYATVFSFLGNSKLSKYYSQMRKRLEGNIGNVEQILKNQTFRNLAFNTPQIAFSSREYVGTFYKIETTKFLFVGVDVNLLSFEGFINFQEYNEDIDTQINDDHYILYKDGILIIEINNINNYSQYVEISSIRNYQEQITISDIDEMNEISLSKYFKYLLEKNDFYNIREEYKISNINVDLIATHNEIQYYFEFKIFKKKKISRLNIPNYPISENYENRYFLVTNSSLIDDGLFHKDIRIIERSILNEIIKNPYSLIEILNNLINH
jgi:hypothetical protein